MRIRQKRPVEKEQHYKNIINKQKVIIKELKKKLSRAGKSQERFENLQEELDFIIEEEERYDRQDNTVEELLCPECNKGTLEFIDLGIRKMLRCSKCKYRKVNK